MWLHAAIQHNKEKQRSHRPIVIGFAAETGNLINNRRSKLSEKGLDFIVANLVPATFGTDTINAIIMHKDGKLEELPNLTQLELADKIADE